MTARWRVCGLASACSRPRPLPRPAWRRCTGRWPQRPARQTACSRRCRASTGAPSVMNMCRKATATRRAESANTASSLTSAISRRRSSPGSAMPLRLAETEGLPWETDGASKHLAREENRRVVLGPFPVAAIRSLILTGARLREILHARWDQADTERSILFLADSKTGRKPLYLNAPALEGLLTASSRQPAHHPRRQARPAPARSQEAMGGRHQSGRPRWLAHS